MKPMTKQLAIAASVTVLSLGIRQVRLSNHRANTIESAIVTDTGESTPARPSDPENQRHPEQPLYVNAEPDNYPADSYTVDAEPDPQYANGSDSDEQVPAYDHSKAKSFKGYYAKSEGSQGLQRIPMGDYENIYITGEGELWYTSEQPDGSGASKTQVQIDDTTGEIDIVDNGEELATKD